MVISERSVATVPKEELSQLLYKMSLIRRFEEKAAEMYGRGRIKGFLHLYVGQEAVGVGLMSKLRPDDYIFSHYREHGHALARGLEVEKIMAELFGKATGVSRGLGGSMHLFDVSKRFMGGYAIVGGQLPLACGAALTSKRLGHDNVAVTIFGDGTVNEGSFHESLNLASVWKLPVLFVCENNLYGMGTGIARASVPIEIYKRAAGYDMPSVQVDGMDVIEVQKQVEEGLRHIRAGEGPYFIEAKTFRFRGHSMADPELYRDKAEVERWRQHDPLHAFKQALLQSRQLSQTDIEQIDARVETEIEDAVRFAEESPFPAVETLTDNVYAPSPADRITRSKETTADA